MSHANVTPRICQRLVILGLGLIGGSLAKACKANNLVGDIVAWGHREASLQKGLDQDVIDRYSLDLAKAIEGADIIVVATPVLHAQQLLVDLFRVHQTQAIVTDVGSTKGNLLAAIQNALPELPENLVLAHPIAGSEQSGVDAAKVDLFNRRRIILTPCDNANADAVNTVQQLWQGTGALVDIMSVEHHDKILAATSHLPHVLAYTLVNALMSMGEDKTAEQEKAADEVFRFAAGGFKDFTRIASSHPQMWHDIVLANSDALLASIDLFDEHLNVLRDAIKQGNSERIMQLFMQAKIRRDAFVKKYDENK